MSHYDCKYCGGYMCIDECDESKAAHEKWKKEEVASKGGRTVDPHFQAPPPRDGPPANPDTVVGSNPGGGSGG